MARITTSASNLNNVLESLTQDFMEDHIKSMAKRTVDRTPADSGRAKASITLSTGSPEVTDNGQDPSGAYAKSAIDSVNINIGEKAYVTMGVDYGGVLEYGSSEQAPNGFMRSTVSEAQQHANKSAKKL